MRERRAANGVHHRDVCVDPRLPHAENGDEDGDVDDQNPPGDASHHGNASVELRGLFGWYAPRPRRGVGNGRASREGFSERATGKPRTDRKTDATHRAQPSSVRGDPAATPPLLAI